MKRILVPVNGSDDSMQAVREALHQAYPPGRAEVHLLNIQQHTFPEETLASGPVENIDAYYYERSHMALAPAERLLREAGIPFVSHHVVGPVAEMILEKQAELECDSIVMGTRIHAGGLGAPLFSVTARVLESARVPVTLVKKTMAPEVRDGLSAI